MKQLSDYNQSIRDIEEYFNLDKNTLGNYLIDDMRDEYWYSDGDSINWTDDEEMKQHQINDPHYSEELMRNGLCKGPEFTLVFANLQMGHNSEIAMIFNNENEIFENDTKQDSN